MVPPYIFAQVFEVFEEVDKLEPELCLFYQGDLLKSIHMRRFLDKKTP
jgi:hypothetical protein